MATPSREFMVRQSILDAYEAYADSETKRLLSRATALGCYTVGDWVRRDFCDAVRAEYRRIANSYGVSA
jgi:hypothetical protein